MTAQKFPMTADGHEKLVEELAELKKNERPRLIAAIADARRHGDLSENAEYHAAKEKQKHVEGRISEIETKLASAQVINLPPASQDTIVFGATVTLEDDDTEAQRTYRIVGEDEANIEKGLLSVRSPLARGLVGKSVDDDIEIQTPSGQKTYTVLSILYK
ncbi:MAG: transcription elongation factor GreA [Holosporaceae bacterium]